MASLVGTGYEQNLKNVKMLLDSVTSVITIGLASA